MVVLDVGCGVGGPAREIVKFSGANVVGLNNNDYQIERATRYAAKEGLSDKLSFTKGDFMVSSKTSELCGSLLTGWYSANVIPREQLRRCVCH